MRVAKKRDMLVEQGRSSSKKIFLLLLCGALIGLVNGFFGGGGGMICVPLLEKVLAMPKKCAHATALVVIFPISFVSAVIYCLSGHLESISFLIVSAGVVVGGILGSFLLKILPEKVVRVTFVFIMLAGGLKMIF